MTLGDLVHQMGLTPGYDRETYCEMQGLLDRLFWDTAVTGDARAIDDCVHGRVWSVRFQFGPDRPVDSELWSDEYGDIRWAVDSLDEHECGDGWSFRIDGRRRMYRCVGVELAPGTGWWSHETWLYVHFRPIGE